MIKQYFYLVMTVVLLSGMAKAQRPDSLFSQAQRAYDNGNFPVAIQLYQKILGQNRESASLHYNLGNAYFKDNQLGEAILHYEKARRLHPRDEDIAYNLKVAKARIRDRITPPESSIFMTIFNGIKYWLNLSELGWTTVLLFLLFSIAFAAWRLISTSRVKTIAGYAAVIIALIFLLAAPLLLSRTLETYNEVYGIVLNPEVNVHSAPQSASTEVFVIHEGTRVQVEEQRPDWYQIKLVDGKEGWVSTNTIGII